MRIVVLLAGVHDAKWPVPPAGEHGVGRIDEQVVLSPFDEAALEMALRIRDSSQPATIAAVLANGGQRLARQVVALNIADVSLIQLPAPWDQRAVAGALAECAAGADVVLIGREFGDHDDGLVPPLIAELLGLPYFARAQVVELDGEPRFVREAETALEACRGVGPLLVSVTNDRRTRLRKPLMKNVMMARQVTPSAREVAAGPSAGLALEGFAPKSTAAHDRSCTMLTGDSAQVAGDLARLLWDART